MAADKTSEKNFTTTKVEFGKPIKYRTSLEETTGSKGEKKNQMGADAMISQFINMKKNYHDRLVSMAQSDRHAKRYFCVDDCAFIFDYKVMKALCEVIEAANPKTPQEEIEAGIFFFQGLKKGKPRQASTANGLPPAFGRPTLIAAPYNKKGKGYEHLTFQIEPVKRWFPKEFADKFLDDTYDGFQHPGNGNSGLGDPPPTAEKLINERPVVVDPGDENDDTDYVIKKTITVEDLKTWFNEK